ADAVSGLRRQRAVACPNRARAVSASQRCDRGPLEEAGLVQPALRGAQVYAPEQVAGVEAERVPDRPFRNRLVSFDNDFAHVDCPPRVDADGRVGRSRSGVDGGGCVDTSVRIPAVLKDGANARDGRIQLEEVEWLPRVDGNESIDLRARQHGIELIYVNGAHERRWPFDDLERDGDFVVVASLDNSVYRGLPIAALPVEKTDAQQVAE